MVVGVPLVFEGQSSVADVVQILQPLEVRHGHTAGVQIHVLQETQPSRIPPGSLSPLKEPRNHHYVLLLPELAHARVCVCDRAYRNNHDVVPQEDLVGVWGGGTVSTFCDDLKRKKN